MIISRLLIGTAFAALAASAATADTVRIAEHRQARIDALTAVVPQLEEATGHTIEVIEYPGPDREYVSKLLTELGAGTGPDIFSLPNIGQVLDFAAAGYMVELSDAFDGWDGFDGLYPVAQDLATGEDGTIYALPTMLSAQQFYFRRDILEANGIPTDQPESWDALIDLAILAKEKTGAYSLMLPMGVTWGGGPFIEGFGHMLAGSSTPSLVTEDGKLHLSSQGVLEVFEFYQALVDNELLPIDPLLGPEPWVIPKYQMFPNGELLATTCGSWCYIFDWGPESSNPIENVTEAVGTWEVPKKDGGDGHVMVGLGHPWSVNANAVSRDASVEVLKAMAMPELAVSYAEKEGNLPARKSVAESEAFQKLTALAPLTGSLENGTYLEAAPNMSTVFEGVGRATEALLLGNADAAGAQQILVDYVTGILGEDAVE